jgi:integrase
VASTLTATAVKNARASIARRELPDAACPGLHLAIEPSGSKRWALRYRRPDGRSARLVLGSVHVADQEPATEPVIGGHLTLASARRLVAMLRHEIAQGRDPGAAHLVAKQRHRVEADARAANTFGAAARDFIEQYAAKRIRRWKEQAHLLGLHPTAEGLEVINGGLAKRWADKAIAEIDGHDIHALIDETRHRGAPGLERRAEGPTEGRARAMFGCLSKMFKWLVQHRRVEANPCASVHRPETPQSRDRVLTDAEIVKFWSAATAERVEFGALLKLLLLTGCRLNEVAGMRRDEIDGATWTIPGARTKNRRVHVVPLAPLARQLIASVPGNGELVFTTDGRSPVSVGSKIKRRLDQAMKIPPWRLHDLRRTFVTGLAELGIRPDVIELTVNHISGLRGGIAGVYNRSELLPERRAALERWATHVHGLVAARPENVVSLRGRRK